MPDLLIKNANIVLSDKISKQQNVLCRDGKIANITPSNEACGAEEIIDAAGNYLAPGFIDLHFHGLHKYLINNGSDDVANICKLLPQYGVTGFLPGVCPMPKGKDAEFLDLLSHIESQGAQILGFHLEGPFLTLAGALPPDTIGSADKERVEALIKSAKPYKAIFSISPDLAGIIELIPLMAEGNCPVFMTHTKADVKQTQAAIEAGVRHATHFYDVFPFPEETEPGVRPCGTVEAIFADERVSVDFILDGEHVEPIAVKMALQCKGPDKVCLITDANIGTGFPPGVYHGIGDTEFVFAYPGGPARMTENSLHPGGLVGSGLTMNLAVKNAVQMLDIDLPLAVKMASNNPARVLGLNNQKGQIRNGFDADLVLLNKNLEVEQTFVAGKCCYKK